MVQVPNKPYVASVDVKQHEKRRTDIEGVIFQSGSMERWQSCIEFHGIHVDNCTVRNGSNLTDVDAVRQNGD